MTVRLSNYLLFECVVDRQATELLPAQLGIDFKHNVHTKSYA